jgi:hypothetical protein
MSDIEANSTTSEIGFVLRKRWPGTDQAASFRHEISDSLALARTGMLNGAARQRGPFVCWGSERR